MLVRDLADKRNVVTVGEGFALDLDWSDPTPQRLDSKIAARILERFGGDDLPAVPLSRGVSSTDRGRWERLFGGAQELRREQRTAEALMVYRRIARDAPSRRLRAEAWFTIAQVRYSTGDLAGAERDLEAHADLLAGTPFDGMARSYLTKIRSKRMPGETPQGGASR